jgi:hypothetical protein
MSLAVFGTDRSIAGHRVSWTHRRIAEYPKDKERARLLAGEKDQALGEQGIFSSSAISSTVVARRSLSRPPRAVDGCAVAWFRAGGRGQQSAHGPTAGPTGA